MLIVQPKKRTYREAGLEAEKPEPAVKKLKGVKMGVTQKVSKVAVSHKGRRNPNERILVKFTSLNDQMKKEVKKVPEKFSNIIVDEGDIDYFSEVVD